MKNGEFANIGLDLGCKSCWILNKNFIENWIKFKKVNENWIWDLAKEMYPLPFQDSLKYYNTCSILHKPKLVIDQPKEVIALYNHFFLKNKYGDNSKNLGARVASCFHKGERKGVQIPTWHILMLPITPLGVH